MRDLVTLEKHLLATEFEFGQNFYHTGRAQGYAPAKLVAMAYRAGCQEGKEGMQQNLAAAYKRRDAALDRVTELEAIQQEPIRIIDNIPRTSGLSMSPELINDRRALDNAE